MKALILTAHPQQGQALRDSFTASGFEVEVESSGLFAMTALERQRPDVIVSTAKLDEMSGTEFYEMVRSDPVLSLMCFVLLDDQTPAEASNFDKVIPPQTMPADVVRIAYKLILDVTRKTYEFSVPAVPRHRSISGTLGEISLFELAQWLARSAKTGRLSIQIGLREAIWLFCKGQLIHAEYEGKSGEDAVLQLLILAERQREGQFGFEPLDESAFFLEPITIRKTTDQLLLSLAVEMDHMQLGQAGSN